MGEGIPGRLARLRAKLPELGVEGIMVTQPENRRYLSGFSGSAGTLFVSAERAVLATDFRYWAQSEVEAPEFELFPYRQTLARQFAELIELLGIRRLGFEAPDLSVALYYELSQVGEPAGVELAPLASVVEELRRVKEPAELALIEQGVTLADAAFTHAAEVARPGMTERELAWAIERYLREHGAEAVAFPIIVAAGPRSALPHAQPGDRPIQPGEPIVLDLGARMPGGYHSDLTRTIVLGRPDAHWREVYPIVLAAAQAAIASVGAGRTGGEVDAAARNVIAAAGYGDKFGHGTGHGVGLAIHEAPAIRRDSPDHLLDGMVFSIEPGIYLPGWGGIRIEDLIVVEQGRARVLSQALKLPV